MSEHQHVFHRTRLTYDDSTPIDGGRRCSCGLEVVGDGPFSVNAAVVRASHNFNKAVTEAMTRLGKSISETNRRQLP